MWSTSACSVDVFKLWDQHSSRLEWHEQKHTFLSTAILDGTLTFSRRSQFCSLGFPLEPRFDCFPKKNRFCGDYAIQSAPFFGLFGLFHVGLCSMKPLRFSLLFFYCRSDSFLLLSGGFPHAGRAHQGGDQETQMSESGR